MSSSDSKQASRVYHISFRWSVPDSDHKTHQPIIQDVCKRLFDKYIYQLENTNTDGRDNYHYQGYGHLITKSRPGAIQKIAISCNGSTRGIEMSAASTAGISTLKDYAMKTDTRVAGPWADKRIYLGQDLITNLYPWQREIKQQCDEDPDDRTINVLYNEGGNIGKSAFCKYMAWHFKAPVCGWAKSGDILNLVSKMSNMPVYLFDLSRSKPQDWAKDDIPAAMEGIKNGLFVNTKYETSQVIMACPHVWMFCNHLPNIYSMSRDRWRFWSVNPISKELVRISSAEVSRIIKNQKRDASPVRRRSSSPRRIRRSSSSQSTVPISIDDDDF